LFFSISATKLASRSCSKALRSLYLRKAMKTQAAPPAAMASTIRAMTIFMQRV